MAKVHRILAKLQARDQASPTFRKVGGAVKLLGAVSAAVGAVQIGRYLVGGLRQATKYALEQERVDTQLAQSIRNVGLSVQKQLPVLKAQANALQQVTGVANETIQGGQALLVAMGRLSGEGLDRATRAALDLAAANDRLGTGASFDLIAKAATGYTSTLSRYGIILDESIPKAEKFNAALEFIEKRFGGQAAAQIETVSGQTKLLGENWADFLKAVGELLTKSGAVREFLTGLNELLVDITGNVEDGDFTGFVEGAVGAIARMVGASVQGIEASVIGLKVVEAEFLKFKAASLAIIGEVAEKTALVLQGLAFTPAGAGAAAFVGPLKEAAGAAREGAEQSAEAWKRTNAEIALGVYNLGLLTKDLEEWYAKIEAGKGAENEDPLGVKKSVKSMQELISLANSRKVELIDVESVYAIERPLAWLWEQLDQIETKTGSMKRNFRQAFDDSAEDAAVSADRIANVFATGLGGAFQSLVTGAKSVTDALKGAAQSMISSLIGLLVQMGVQRLATSAVVQGSEAAEGAAELSTALAAVYANSFASVAAIPLVGAYLAPGVAAANLAAATAGAAGAQAAGAGLGAAGAAGFAEGGVVGGYAPGRDTVPAMLSPGEMVLTPEVTDRLINGGAGGGNITIELRSDIKQTATALNSAVRGGQVRLAATDTVSPTRTRR